MRIHDSAWPVYCISTGFREKSPVILAQGYMWMFRKTFGICSNDFSRLTGLDD